MRDTSFEHVVVLVFSPISSRQSSLETRGNSLSFEEARYIIRQLKFVVVPISFPGIVDLLVDSLFHFFDDFSELLLEYHIDEGSSHVESFLSVVIPIIFNGSTEVCLDQPVSHISSKERLFEFITGFDSYVRQ